MHLTKLHSLADAQCHLQSEAAHLAAALTILPQLLGAGADALASQKAHPTLTPYPYPYPLS